MGGRNGEVRNEGGGNRGGGSFVCFVFHPIFPLFTRSFAYEDLGDQQWGGGLCRPHGDRGGHHGAEAVLPNGAQRPRVRLPDLRQPPAGRERSNPPGRRPREFHADQNRGRASGLLICARTCWPARCTWALCRRDFDNRFISPGPWPVCRGRGPGGGEG